MKKGRFRLRISDYFCAAHQLRNYCGKCENLHGHNFGVEIEVEGSLSHGSNGILIDFKVLKEELKSVLSGLEHGFLNEIPPFTEIEPTSENLARFLYRELEKNLGKYAGVGLKTVAVSEKEGRAAVYSEE